MESQLNVSDFLHIVRKKIVLIIFIPLFFGGVGAYISYFVMTPIYEARVDLLVNNTVSTADNQLTAMDIETNLQLIETYQFIIQSDYILDKVRESYDQHLSNDTLKKKIRIETNQNSQIISLYIRDQQLQQSVEVANLIATTIRSEVKDLMNIENINILTYASEEKHLQAVAPKPLFYTVLSLLIGFFMTMIYILLSAYFQMRINSKSDIDKFLQLPFFGSVGKISANQLKQSTNDHIVHTNFIRMAPEIIEAFRTIRTNIQFQSKVSQLQSIVITSASKNEGKSMICNHLARTMAFDHKKTIIIDADFRNKNKYDSKTTIGLSSYLAGYHTVEEIIRDTSTQNLKMICTGPTPPMSTELLSSPQMDMLLATLKQAFDFIIIDSPPLLLADAIILATKADGCLLITEADKTKVKHIRLAIEQLKQVNAIILGVVLNKAKVRKREIREYNNGKRWKQHAKQIKEKSYSQ